MGSTPVAAGRKLGRRDRHRHPQPRQFLISPLGFTKAGKNINYYDDVKLEKAVLPFIVKSLDQLMAMGFSKDKCFCIGEGKNFKFLQSLNEEHGWFKEIIPLAHPRFIMQYKRKKLKQYIAAWCDQLR